MEHSIRYYSPFPLVETNTKKLRTEDSLHRFKTKNKRTDLTTITDGACRNCMLKLIVIVNLETLCH